ncbi:MAG: hypothetical protein KatS3mg031_1902 [Chitinophagales bacterium]|nr:MAG: hypothetical protein KatS3mg031_1902 [Chitinophagales bacterium]
MNNGFTSPASIGARLGLLAGLLCILYFLMLYAVQKDLVISFWVFAGYGIIIFFKILAVHLAWKGGGNRLEFKKGLQAAFLVSVTSMALWILFFHILFAFIDTELNLLAKEKALQRIEKFMSMAGAPDDKIEEALELAEQRNYAPSFSSDAMNYAWSLIIGFLYAAVIGAIYHYAGRKTPPLQKPDAA